MTHHTPHTQINAIIIGASGYTGVELINLLLHHPYVSINGLVADSNAGKAITELYPHLYGAALPPLVTLDAIDWTTCDVAFCCLPHKTSHQTIQKLPSHIKIIDLSADFRFSDTETYSTWYDTPHPYPELQKEAVFGLTEWSREALADARIVACPGCYPTSSLLPLIPLIQHQAIDPHSIIIDAKSGTTGAGKSANTTLLFSEINEDLKAYNINTHRHAPEIEEKLSSYNLSPVHIQFTPHLVPMSRGILSTIYINSPNHSLEQLTSLLTDSYHNAPFVHITDAPPHTKEVTGSNQCRIHLSSGRLQNQFIIISVIDNLIKGSSGQAIQNMNIMFNYPETTGLPLFARCP